MSKIASQSMTDRRQFFRATGTIYLSIHKGVQVKEHWFSHASSARETMDLISLRLMNYSSRLHYDKPEGYKYLLELTDIVGHLHKALLENDSFLKHLPKARKQSVIISAASLEFVTEDSFTLGERLTLDVTFPDYPYTTLTLEAEVTRIEAYGSGQRKHRICLLYEDINEADRECIIKYVNHLQRKKIIR